MCSDPIRSLRLPPVSLKLDGEVTHSMRVSAGDPAHHLDRTSRIARNGYASLEGRASRRGARPP
jgi:hypothetical protein